MSSPRIAFLGLGIMGTGMARRLRGAGFAVTVHNRSPGPAAVLAAEGFPVAATPREAAAGADVVIAMVADDAASRSTWLGNQGALTGLGPGSLAVECSTLTVGWVAELAEAAAAKGVSFSDAPVTGSKQAAAAGELNFLVGAAAADEARLRAVLAPMARSITVVGPAGSGATLKLVNNFLAGVQVAALGEAVAWLERTGLDRARALTLLIEGATGSPLVRTIAGRIAAGDFTPNFKLALMAKDLGYAQAEALAAGVPLATAAAALGDFQRAVAAGLGDQDMAAVGQPLRRR